MSLRNALAEEFPHTIAFLCCIHAKRNISDHCTKQLGLSQMLTNKILKDIFSSGGLIHCKDRAEFEAQYAKKKEEWKELEAAEKVNPRFVSYFEKNKKEDVYDHMRVKASVDAGFREQIVTTNPIEMQQ